MNAVALYMKKLLGLKNFKPLGSGSYAVVYGAKGHDTVYKIGSVPHNTDGYLRYVTEITKMKKHNPFTPRLYTWWTFTDGNDCDNDVFVISMERLKEIDETDDGVFEAVDVLENLVLGVYQNRRPGENVLGVKVKVPAALNQIASIIMDLNDDRSNLDIHYGNIMMRGEQIVITDPVY